MMPSVEPHIAHEFPSRNAKDYHDAFREQYLALRQRENRLYTDEQIRQLPTIAADHPHHKEWIVRKQSMERLVRHLRNLNRPLNILEVGCGNGWLAHRISEIPGTTVTGFDINLEELQQAKRVFSNQHNLQFRSTNPFSFSSEKPFDKIIFAASIQYFPSLDAIICDALGRLNPGGSIHIIDTHFYTPEEVPAARQRTIEHFTNLGFPGMADYYFHHSLETLSKFNYSILYNPQSIQNKLFGGRDRNPFYWITIKKA